MWPKEFDYKMDKRNTLTLWFVMRVNFHTGHQHQSTSHLLFLPNSSSSVEYLPFVPDLVYAYNKLLPETAYGRRLGEAGTFTSSSISFYWGMKRTIPELDVHNIFLAEAYKSSFDDIFKRHLLPEDPSFYINVPSRIDASAAPAGKDTVVVLLPISHLTPSNEHRIDELMQMARSKVIRIIEKRLKISNFAELIETEVVNDPRTWQSKFNLWKGSILGLAHNITQVLYFRPSTRSHLFKNLYFVGASAHPGKCLLGFFLFHLNVCGFIISTSLTFCRNWSANRSMRRKAS